MKKSLLLFCVSIFWVMVAAYYAAFDVTRYAYASGRPGAETRLVLISPRQGFADITQMLFRAGIVDSPWRFRLFSRVNGFDKRVKAGEYELSGALSPAQIIEILITGKTVLHRITVPEGYTLRQIAGLVGEAGLMSADTFIAAARNPVLAHELGAAGDTLEGYLFPDTYFFSKGVTARDIIIAMVKRVQAVMSAEWRSRADQIKLSLHEVLTLASIIEKETGAASERPLISSVFHNRLRLGMRLETDPTVIYGLSDFNGNLTREHLGAYTPYNTYRIFGLPPGPIASPGKESIHAALYPTDTDFLFFVSKNDGTHHFSTDMKGHNDAVRKYQLGR